MRSTDHNRTDAHILVHWLDTPLPPTRWEQMNRVWSNLPGAIVVAVVVLSIIVPWPSLPAPDVSGLSMPSISLPTGEDGEDDAPAERSAATPMAGHSTTTPVLWHGGRG